MIFRQQNKQMASGLFVLLNETRKYMDSVPKKLEAMQEIYLQKNSDLYSEKEILQLRYYLKASNYKFNLATLSLEHLWSLSHTKRDEVFNFLENSLDRLECSDDEILLISFVFEGFLFQGRAFLDFYMLYICLLLKTGHEGRISKSKFDKAIKKAPPELIDKTNNVKEYFDTKVFAQASDNWLNPENWGLLLRSLRDKIAHRDRLRPSFDGDETLARQILFDWPTLQQTTYDRFCQYMQNGMFELLRELSPILYDVEWKPGPYKPNLWLEDSTHT
ncbi:MAG: hypothetical protein GY805_05290 [Chloroflexi bacterium]|nr:hypothetical protein [Chloroflexota bacterium]